MPEQAERALERDPQGLLEIIEIRSFVQTRQQLLSAQNEEQAPKGAMADLVMEVEYELIQERHKGE